MPRTPFQGKADPRNGKGPKKGAPNAGRPPSSLRAMMRASLAERLEVANQIIDGGVMARVSVDGRSVKRFLPAKISERVQALEFLAKYGVGPKQKAQQVQHSGALALTVHFVEEGTS